MKYLNTSGTAIHLADFTGSIDYPLTNDYMFRSVMQSNKNVLKGLLCSLLHLHPEDIHHIHILNPIELGKAIDNKDFMLDIKILMNDNSVINLEMQMHNQYNWPDRSLSYLSRLFDRLHTGEDYSITKHAFQIGLLGFTPFPEHPEFFSTYQMINVKDHHKYSDKFTIHMLNLTQIEAATAEDKQFGLDSWAKLFQTKTWENFTMISADNSILQQAGETMYALNMDDQIRYQCEAREDYRRTWNTIKREMDEKDSIIADLREQLAKFQEQSQSQTGTPF